MSITAYKRTISDTESPRQIERRVFLQVTSELEDKSKAYDETQDKAERLRVLSEGLRDALWRNQKLWMAVRNDVVEPGNDLPPALKAGLISLALFVDTHTASLMKTEKTVKPLLDMNRSIIRGLEGNPLRVME